ncbi:MAG: T9SS type A sorting domain-containing protein, partial [Nitrososphaeraceae archaeon]
QTSLTYNLEFYASRNSTTADKTILAINGNNIPISTSKNFSNKAFFSNISPDLEGRIKITISKSGTYNYLNGFRITEVTSSSTSRIILEEEKMAAKQSIDSITVSPEPFTNRFALQVQNSHTGIMNIQIQDLNGILRKEFNIIKKEGRIIQIYLAAGELPTGQYIINIQMDGWKASKRVSKK